MRLLPPAATKPDETVTITRDDVLRIPAQAGPVDIAASSQPNTSPTAPASVWLVDEEPCQPYDEFVRAHGNLYHSLAWRQALVREGLGRPWYLMAMRAEQVVGVLPLMERESLFGRQTLTSLPHTPHAGIIALDTDAAAVLLDRAQTLAKPRGIHGLTQRRFDRPNGHPPRRMAWVRLSTADVLEYVGSLAPAATNRTFGFRQQRQQTLLAGPARTSAGTDSVLRQLAASGGHPGSLALRDADDQMLAQSVWLVQRGIAYLLVCRWLAPELTWLQLIAATAERLLSADVSWLDAALPADIGTHLAGLLALESTQVSREDALSAPDPSLTRNRAPDS